jgi:hypothetical protein
MVRQACAPSLKLWRTGTTACPPKPCAKAGSGLVEFVWFQKKPHGCFLSTSAFSLNLLSSYVIIYLSLAGGVPFPTGSAPAGLRDWRSDLGFCTVTRVVFGVAGSLFSALTVHFTTLLSMSLLSFLPSVIALKSLTAAS